MEYLKVLIDFLQEVFWAITVFLGEMIPFISDFAGFDFSVFFEEDENEEP